MNGHCKQAIQACAVVLACAAAPLRGAEYHVSTNGLQLAPYDTWENAFTNLQAAVDFADDGDSVLVANGVFTLSAQLTILKGVTVTGVGGPELTELSGNNAVRCLYLAHPDAVFEGFTIRNGKASAATPVNNGGGVYLASNATVRACVIRNNSASYGSGVYIAYEGLVDRCVIRDNTGTVTGGGIYFLNTTTATYSGGNARNCLITGHSATTYGGGAYFFYGGQMDSCTVVGNWGNYGGGVYSLRGNSTWRNSVIYFNSANPDKGDNWYVNGGGVGYNLCTTPTRGTNCKTGDPTFVDPDAGDYRLRAGSPAIDAGQSNAWMTASARDLDGNARIDAASGKNDIGAYEYQSVSLDVGFTGTPQTLFFGAPVVFVATVSGSATNDVEYLWDLDNDGVTEIAGADKRVVTNYYGYGVHSVALTVTNLLGDVAAQTNLNYILVAAQTAYVATNGTHLFPYTNWVTAATNIQDAIDAGTRGSVVWVEEGVYCPEVQITVFEGIAVRSTRGAERTVVDGRNAVRCLFMNPDAEVDGFTITRGVGGVYFNYGGTVRNSTIVSNTISGSGAGTRAESGGTLDHCNVLFNSATGHGGGTYLNNSFTIRNCLYYGNTSGSFGGGIYFINGGTLESSTVVSNAAVAGGGVCQNKGGAIRNTIVYHNTGGATSNYYLYNVSGVSYNQTCTAPSPDGYGIGNMDSDPLLRSLGTGDCRLKSTSPCADTGLYQTWMAGASDLAGNPRVVGSAVDIGAYELPLPGGTMILLR